VTLGGESLPYAPEFTANATIQYTIPLGGDLCLQPRVTDAFMGTGYSSVFQADYYFEMPAYSLYGADLGLISGP